MMEADRARYAVYLAKEIENRKDDVKYYESEIEYMRNKINIYYERIEMIQNELEALMSKKNELTKEKI